MGFKNNNMSVMAYANGFTVWHYIDKSLQRNEVDDKFFSSISHLCNPGDKMMLNLKDGYFEVIIVEIQDKVVYLKTLSQLYYDSGEAK